MKLLSVAIAVRFCNLAGMKLLSTSTSLAHLVSHRETAGSCGPKNHSTTSGDGK